MAASFYHDRPLEQRQTNSSWTFIEISPAHLTDIDVCFHGLCGTPVVAADLDDGLHDFADVPSKTQTDLAPNVCYPSQFSSLFLKFLLPPALTAYICI